MRERELVKRILGTNICEVMVWIHILFGRGGSGWSNNVVYAKHRRIINHSKLKVL